MSIKGDALSACADFQISFGDRCNGDEALVALLGADADQRIFASTAPSGTPYPYITLGLTTEGDSRASTFDKWGAVGSLRPDIWTERKTQGNMQGLVIYGHLRRIFHGKQVALPSHDVVTCTVELVLDVPDVDGRSHHTQVLITLRTLQHRA